MDQIGQTQGAVSTNLRFNESKIKWCELTLSSLKLGKRRGVGYKFVKFSNVYAMLANMSLNKQKIRVLYVQEVFTEELAKTSWTDSTRKSFPTHQF